MTSADELASIRGEVAELRESIKEQQTGVLAALRTFVSDYEAFRDGKRSFPRAAVLGLAFAYLRPRILLVAGSLAAVVVAGIQIVMFHRQNELLEQQNGFIQQQNSMLQRQERALTAQTTAVLLDGINIGPEDPDPRVSLLGIYGDVGFDVLVDLASSQSASVATTAKTALLKSVKRLETGQALGLFQLLLNDHVAAVAIPGKAGYVDRGVAQLAWELRFEQMSPERRDFGEATYGPIETLLKQWVPTDLQIASLSIEQRRVLALLMAKYYLEQFGSVELGGPLPLDVEMSSLCVGREVSNDFSIRNRVIDLAAQLVNEGAARISLAALIAVVVDRTCSRLSVTIFPSSSEIPSRDLFAAYPRLDDDQVRADVATLLDWLRTHKPDGYSWTAQ